MQEDYTEDSRHLRVCVRERNYMIECVKLFVSRWKRMQVLLQSCVSHKYRKAFDWIYSTHDPHFFQSNNIVGGAVSQATEAWDFIFFFLHHMHMHNK